MEYVLNTLGHLLEMGIHEPALARLPSLMGVPRIASRRNAASNDRTENGGVVLPEPVLGSGPEKPY